MPKFESQLSSFGRQRYAETDNQLQFINNPRPKHISIAWITTPVAAFIGLLIGLGIRLNNTPNVSSPQIANEQTPPLENVIILPEFCYTDFITTIELPKFEIVINSQNSEL